MPEVVTLGLHTIDILGRPVTHIPDGQGAALLEEITITVAGTAAATAIDLARLGHSVATVGAIGDDLLGTSMKQILTSEGVDCSALRTVETTQTSSTILPIRPDGSRPTLHVVGASAALVEDLVPWDVIADAKVLHIGGTGILPGLDGDPTLRVLKRAKSMGVTTTMDFIPLERERFVDRLVQYLPFIDYLLPNIEDSLLLSGTHDLDDAVDWYQTHGANWTAITLGAAGAAISGMDAPTTVLPAYDVAVVDTSGCGDAFSAGFIAAILEGKSPVDATDFACATGSILATGLGSQGGLLDRPTLDRFIDTVPRKHI